MRSVYNAFKVTLTPQYNVVLSGVKVGKAWKANQVCVEKNNPRRLGGGKNYLEFFLVFAAFCKRAAIFLLSLSLRSFTDFNSFL